MRLRVRNGDILATVAELDNLSQWCRPGRYAWLIGGLRAALTDAGKRVYEAHEALLDDCAVFVQGDEGRERATKKVPDGRGGTTDVFVFKDREDFVKRERELVDAFSTVHVDALLTREDVEAIGTEHEKGKGRHKDAPLPAVNVANLRPVLQGYAQVVTDEQPAEQAG